MKSLTPMNRRSKGFSLVELLVVIAVIGVIAAIAIPSMSSIFGESKTAKNQRNAQNIVSMFQAAKSAGVTGIEVLGSNAALDITASLVGGVTVSDTSSPFNGKRFSMGGVPYETAREAMPYIQAHHSGEDDTWADYELDYVSAGGASPYAIEAD